VLPAEAQAAKFGVYSVYMGIRDRRHSGTGWGTLLLAVLCVLLVVVSGTLQVAHTHADGSDTHTDCSLCAAAHITVQVVQHAPAPVPATAVVAVLHTLSPAILPVSLSTFALFTRPPPVAAAAA
jgi:hypothetical protein